MSNDGEMVCFLRRGDMKMTMMMTNKVRLWCVCEVLRDWPLAVRVFPVFVRVHQLSSNLSLMSSWVVLVCVLSNLNKNGQGLKEVIKLKG